MARIKAWVGPFLEALEDTGMVTESCRRAGIGRTTAYEHRQRDEGFALAWHEVEERAIERMEREAYRRAVEGVEKPLVSGGQLVTTCTEYSDGLMTILLKAHRPEKYRDNVKVEHGGTVNVELIPVAVDRGRQVAQLLANTRAVLPPGGTNGNGNGSHG